MQREAIVRIVRDNLGLNNALDVGIILRHMTYMQEEYEVGDGQVPLPWFLFDEKEIAVPANAESFALPQNFIAFDDDFSLTGKRVGDARFVVLKRAYDYQIGQLQRGPGFPCAWVMVGDRIKLYSYPADDFVVRVPGFYRTANFSDTTNNPWFLHFPGLIIAETTIRVAKATRNESTLQLFGSELDSAKSGYLRRVEEMKVALAEIIVGAPE